MDGPMKRRSPASIYRHVAGMSTQTMTIKRIPNDVSKLRLVDSELVSEIRRYFIF